MKRLLPALLILTLLLTLFVPALLLGFAHTPSAEEESAATAEEEARALTLEGRRYVYEGDAEDLSVADDRLTLRRGGAYRISGELKDGSLCVDAGADATVRLILAGVSLRSSRLPPLEIRSAACVILVTEAGTVNTLTDAPRAEDADAILPAACLEARCPLILCGEGALAVSGRASAAIAAAGSLELRGGHLTLSAPHTALWVRDGLCFSAGELTVSAARYGIVVPDSVASAGQARVTGGRLTLVASELAISAPRAILIQNATGSIRAPIPYRCRRQRDGQTLEGVVEISASDFPR